MTFSPRHEQFAVDARLQNHLMENGGTLSELLSAIGYQEALSAFSLLQSGDGIGGEFLDGPQGPRLLVYGSIVDDKHSCKLTCYVGWILGCPCTYSLSSAAKMGNCWRNSLTAARYQSPAHACRRPTAFNRCYHADGALMASRNGPERPFS